MTAKEYLSCCQSQARKRILSFILILLLMAIPLGIFAPNIFTSPPNVYAATSPSLGSATTFGILASTYTNTATGTTITGDLGYTTGPLVAPTVIGTTYIASGIYSGAGSDQGSALSTLNSQPCDFNFGSATDLSLLSQPLTPGVYCVTGAASIGTGGVTLSGSGTYIFIINGAFTTVANSVITLGNGASSCDVFWAPTAATTLGANSTFIGTNIDDAGITIGNTVTWKGRALAYKGTVSTDVDTISTTCVVAPTPTPTATPTTTPTATPTTTTTSSSTETATMTSNNTAISTPCPTIEAGIVPPVITNSRRVDSNSIYISWGPFSGTDKFNVRYGPADGNWLYNTDVTGFSTTLNSLPDNQPIWVQVAARNECQIGTYGKSDFVGNVVKTSSPGFPNTGNPLLPETGFGTRPRQYFCN